MKTYGLKAAIMAVLILLSVGRVGAQPTASPTSFSFTYQVNSTTLPTPGKLTATLPKTATTGYTLTASVSPPMGWLTVTPGGGASPLALTVTVNPTGLSPGSYSGVITLGTNPGTSTTLVPVTLSISNPPSSITVVPAPSVTNYTAGVSGANPALAYNYTTGQAGALPSNAELDVASNGGIIPFTVAAASGSKTANWLKINVANQLPSLQTSGVALAGSYVPIYVTIDLTALTTLNVGPYAGTITFTNNASGAVAAVINVSLNVSAGPPTITSIFPASVIAAPSNGRVPPGNHHLWRQFLPEFLGTAHARWRPAAARADTGVAQPAGSASHCQSGLPDHSWNLHAHRRQSQYPDGSLSKTILRALHRHGRNRPGDRRRR